MDNKGTYNNEAERDNNIVNGNGGGDTYEEAGTRQITGEVKGSTEEVVTDEELPEGGEGKVNDEETPSGDESVEGVDLRSLLGEDTEGDEQPEYVEDTITVEEPEDTEVLKTNRLIEETEKYRGQRDNVDLITSVDFALVNNEGEYMSTRIADGEVYLKAIEIERIIKPSGRARIDENPVHNLQEQIRKFGQLQPIQVVEWGEYYLIVDGLRRVQASINLGETDILAYVDGTIPAELVKYYEAIINSHKPYTFSETLAYGERFMQEQESVKQDIIEGIFNMEAGEFLKAQYISRMRADFMDIYMQVEKGELTILQASKKLEKEMEKRKKEAEKEEEAEGLQDGDMSHLKNEDELLDVEDMSVTQELGKRKILDPVLRRKVESRDGGHCQCCGFGKGEPDFVGVFNVHHMVAVQYGGADEITNLILLCSNCHTLVHDYEKGRFQPDEETYSRHNWVKRVVVLGNMLVALRKKGIAIIRQKHESTARLMDRGKITIGQALHKHNVDLKGKEMFNDSPYNMFINVTQDLEYGGGIIGELGVVSWQDEEPEPVEGDGEVKEGTEDSTEQ